MGKRLTAERWFGPLEDRLEILEATLLFIDDGSPSESELHAWISNETNASDEENIGRQIGFLRTIELLKTIDGQYVLTDRAHEYLDTENTDVLFIGLIRNVAGFENILSELYAGPKDLEEITSILQNQSAFSGGSGVAERHIEWLQLLGYVVSLEENRYKLTTPGKQVIENMSQTFHIDDYVQRQLETYKESQDRQQRLEQAQSIASLVQDLVTELIKEYPTRIDSEALSILRRLTQADPKVATKKDRVADLELPEDTITEFQSRIIDAGLVGGGQADIPMPESHEDDAYEFLNTVLNSDEPETLDKAVEDFAELDINGVKTGVLSPILYCLKPRYFPILNSGSIDAVAEHFDIGVSNNLSEYPANASTFRRLQSEVGLGGENGDLRDIDWFLYTLNKEEEEETQQQLFKVPLAGGGMKEGFNRTVIDPVSTETLEAHLETTFDRETIPLWGTRTEVEAVEPGDWLLFGDRETESYIAAGQVSSYGAEKVSEDTAEAIRDAVGWSDEATYPGLIYLDTIHQFEVPAQTVWEILDYADFTYSGFQKVGESTLEDHIIDNPEFGSVDAFIKYVLDPEPTAEAYLFGIPSNQFGSSDSLNPSYRLTESSPIFKTLTPETTIVGIDTDGVLRAVGTSITVESDEDATGEAKSSQEDSSSTVREIEWTYILSKDDGIPLSELDTGLTQPSEGAVIALEADTINSLREEIREVFLEAHQTRPYETHDTETLKRLLEAKQQLVFYGPPGTGKTYTATRFAEWLRAKRDRNVAGVKQLRTVTFHPSFAYEDFLEGFTANVEDDDVAYEYDAGSLKEIVEDAREAYDNHTGSEPAPPFVLIIDEINRGNLAQIFGETITLLESDKRLGETNEITTNLAHSGEEFAIPPNLYVIGTMNTADESIALVDTALRRRFRFLSFPPQLEIPMNEGGFTTAGDPDRETLIDTIKTGTDRLSQLRASSILAIETLNERIRSSPQLGRGKQLGHTYLLEIDSTQGLIDRWQYELLPQLEEYYFGQFGRLKTQLFDDMDVGLFDWEHNQIASLTAETLYASLCEIAGIDEEEQAPLAEKTKQDPGKSQAANSWEVNKSIENFLADLGESEPTSSVHKARELIDFGDRVANIELGNGEKRARVHIKHPDIGDIAMLSLRQNGNLGMGFSELLNKKRYDVTDADVIPALEKLEEVTDFEYNNENRGEWTEKHGPLSDDLELISLSEEDIEILKEAYEIFIEEATAE